MPGKTGRRKSRPDPQNANPQYFIAEAGSWRSSCDGDFVADAYALQQHDTIALGVGTAAMINGLVTDRQVPFMDKEHASEESSRK